jgi:hypothetical protein
VFAAIMIFPSLVGLIGPTYRGPLLIVVGYGLVLTAFARWRMRLIALFVGAAVVTLLWADIVSVAAKVSSKFEAVGMNNKLEEALGVFTRDVSVAEFVFGTGAGGEIRAAGAGYNLVTFTHNVFSYAYAKFGVVVLIVLVWCCLKLARQWRLIWRRDYLPEALTLGYVALFQAGFKHFGFGLVLGLLLAKLMSERRYAMSLSDRPREIIDDATQDHRVLSQ